MGFDLDTLQRRQFAVRIFGLGGAHSIRGYWCGRSRIAGSQHAAPLTYATRRDNYFDEVHGILFVVDSADAARLDLVGQVFGEVMGQQRVSGKPILVFANKQDLSGALSSAEIAQRLRLPEYKASPVHIQASVALVEPESTDERRRTPDPSIPTVRRARSPVRTRP
jgi:GTPase SAR1 family protein